jgi:hypothetical protein
MGLARAGKQIKDGLLVEDLPASERFYTGGDSTIRGFLRDAVGAPNTLTASAFPTAAAPRYHPEPRAAHSRRRRFRPQSRSPTAATFQARVGAGSDRAARRRGVRARYSRRSVRCVLDIGFPTERHIVGGALEKPFRLYFSFGHAF